MEKEGEIRNIIENGRKQVEEQRKKLTIEVLEKVNTNFGDVKSTIDTSVRSSYLNIKIN